MFTKILVNLNDSQPADKILLKVANLAKALKAGVVLFHSCHGQVFGVGEPAPGDSGISPAAGKQMHERLLARAAKDLKGRGVNANWMCVEDMPPWEVVAYAQKNAYILYWPSPGAGPGTGQPC